jgi:tRNA(adenine34) deaminase
MQVESYIRAFQEASEPSWRRMERDLLNRRRSWFLLHERELDAISGDVLEKAYRMLLLKLEIAEEEAPIVSKTDSRLVFHSRNDCPSLEACIRAGIDTRIACRRLFERPTDALVRMVDPALRFTRNYEKIRPYSPYCEEIIYRAAAAGRGKPTI